MAYMSPSVRRLQPGRHVISGLSRSQFREVDYRPFSLTTIRLTPFSSIYPFFDLWDNSPSSMFICKTDRVIAFLAPWSQVFREVRDLGVLWLHFWCIVCDHTESAT